MSKNKPSENFLEGRATIFAGIFLAALAFFMLSADIGGPGITWDEAIYIPAASNYITWSGEILEGLKTGGLRSAVSAESIHLHWRLNWENPPLAKYAAAVFMQVSAGFIEPVSAARMSSAAFFSLTVFLICLIGGRLYGARAGVLSGAFFIIMPRVFGHGRLASLEMSLVFSWTLCVYLFLKLDEGRKTVVFAGAALGLALLSKMNAIIIPLIYVLWGILYRRGNTAKHAAAICLIAGAAVIIMWPWLWHFTLRRIAGYIHFHFMRGHLVPVFYLGRVYSESPAPFHYPFIMTLFTLPPAALFFFACKLKQSFSERFRNPREALVFLNAAVPLLVLTLPFIGKYDGIRLFLPAFPFIAVLAGGGLQNALGRIKENFGGKFVLPAAVFVLVISLTPISTLNPFQLSYYNALAGGVGGARRLGMETTYWGDTLNREVIDHLNENLPGEAGAVFHPAGSLVVRMKQITGRLREDIREIPVCRIEEADYLILIKRQGMIDPGVKESVVNLKPEFSNGRKGVPFTEVYRLK